MKRKAKKGKQMESGVEEAIRAAFRGVTLEQGMSLRRAQVADRYGRPEVVRHGEVAEITDDWERVPFAELEGDGNPCDPCIAHLDAAGLRYYIPALMLSVLDHYDGSSMRVIGTLGALYPKKEAWGYHMQRYSLLNSAQKAAIARFLGELPTLVELDPGDQRIVERALRNYWGEFLERKGVGQ